MSTIDSALLSLGSIITGDLLGQRLASQPPERALRASRITSWVLMLVMAVLAIVLPQSIWALMVFKFELLVQLGQRLKSASEYLKALESGEDPAGGSVLTASLARVLSGELESTR